MDGPKGVIYPMRRWFGLLVAFLTIALGLKPAMAQESSMSLDDAIGGYETAAHMSFQGIPEDWSTHFVSFSPAEPGSAIEADPRYWIQQIRRRITADATSTAWAEPDFERRRHRHAHRDWSMDLGSGATVGAGQFPAKFSFSTNGTPSCTSDYVAFNTGLLGSATQASIVAYNQLYKSPTCTGTVPATDWAYNTGGTVTVSPILSIDGTQIAFVQTVSSVANLVLLKWNAGPATHTTPVATHSSTSLTAGTFTAADVGALITGSNIPADTYITAQSGTTATISKAATSTTTITATVNAETAAAPGVPPSVATSSYSSCTAPCMTTIAFNGSPNDTTSAPFYDYSGSDTIYVGDSAGKLHKFKPVFGSGTPVEVTTGGFPVTVSQSTTKEPLASPVFDSGTGQVFVGDGHTAGDTGDGELHAIVASTGTLTNSEATICHGTGYADPPLLDPTASRLYIGCGDDEGSTSGTICTSTSGNSCIRQFAENFASGTAGTPASLGTTADEHIYPGAFDNIYLDSSSGSSPTGNLYVCGNPGGEPALYRVPITSNGIGTPVSVATLSTTTNTTLASSLCSPVTEFYNTATSTDWMFVGTAGAGNQTGCTATGCVYNFNATTALPAEASTVKTVATAGLTATSGASGLIIDNIGATTSTVANVYYSTLGNQACATSGGTGGCAVQATQSGLQ
jgi:hypothetical protein